VATRDQGTCFSTRGIPSKTLLYRQKVSNSLDLEKSEDHVSDKKEILKKLSVESEAQRQKKSALIEEKVTKSLIKKNSVSDIVMSSLTALIPSE